ncbi:Clathrin light chain 1 [Linum perenne]
MASFDSFGVGEEEHTTSAAAPPPPPPFDDESSFMPSSHDHNHPPQNFDDSSAAGFFSPPPPPNPFPDEDTDDNNGTTDPHSQETYGFSSANQTPNPDFESPFDAAGNGIDGGDGGSIFVSEGPVLPDHSQMVEEGSQRREWRRQNAIHLEEKENREKEMRNQIINEAEEYKRRFYEKRNQNCDTNKAHNREREKLYYANQEKFHKEADKNCWKAIAEIIPREVAKIESRRSSKKDSDSKQASVIVVQGPKPGKPTDMVRMRQIIFKLKQNPPAHMMPKEEKKGDGKDGKKEGESKDAKDGAKNDNSNKDGKKEEKKDDSKKDATDKKPSESDNAAAANSEKKPSSAPEKDDTGKKADDKSKPDPLAGIGQVDQKQAAASSK